MFDSKGIILISTLLNVDREESHVVVHSLLRIWIEWRVLGRNTIISVLCGCCEAFTLSHFDSVFCEWHIVYLYKWFLKNRLPFFHPLILYNFD